MNRMEYVFGEHGYNLVRVISRILGNEFKVVHEEDRVVFRYIHNNKAVIELLNNPSMVCLHFHVPVPILEGVVYADKQWIYEGDRVEDILLLVEMALQNHQKQHP